MDGLYRGVARLALRLPRPTILQSGAGRGARAVDVRQDEGDRVRLSVKDAGTGFEPDSMNKLFEPFYTTKIEGMGMGLSVSRSIIESHHGLLWAQPNDGPGATFSFSIPCAAKAGTDAAGHEGNALTDQKYAARHG